MAGTALVTAMNDNAVILRGFGKRYGKAVAVDGVDLDIARGEIFGLIGPDGAGKSSLMKAVAGVLTFDSGSIDVFGTRIDSERAAETIKARLGLMPQGLGQNLYGDLSIEENIDFFARLRLVPADVLAERKKTLLGMTRLDRFRNRPMKQLSGGMKQKLGLVCTLIHAPDLVILDEPTTGVDPVSRRDFWTILAELLHEQGITALVSTAYLDEASRFQRMAMLHGGRVLASGTPADIHALSPGAVVTLASDDQVGALARLKPQFPQSEALGPQLRVFVDDAGPGPAGEQVLAALDGLPAQLLDCSDPELEDIFVALLRRRGLADLGDGEAAPAGTRGARPEGIAIAADALTRDFGEFRAVDAVSFSVPQGEIFGLLGANGAGKTTVIKMLCGIMPPSAGSGAVAGADMRSAGRQIKERIGYMSQAFSLYLDLTVAENIRLYAGIYGLDRVQTAERLDWIINMAGLHGYQTMLAADLPMGLRQRLALGCALVHKPQVLFLDEPTSGVDPVGRRQFWDILFRLSRVDGVAILVTTHYMSEAEHCDHISLMFAGRVVADDSPAGLKADLTREAGELLEITDPAPADALAVVRELGFADAALYGPKIHAFSRDATTDGRRLRERLPQASVRVRPVSMEDVFVHLVTRLEGART